MIGEPRHGVLEAAYMFYYASDVAIEESEDLEVNLKKRLQLLIGDALILAEKVSQVSLLV